MQIKVSPGAACVLEINKWHCAFLILAGSCDGLQTAQLTLGTIGFKICDIEDNRMAELFFSFVGQRDEFTMANQKKILKAVKAMQATNLSYDEFHSLMTQKIE